MRYVLIVLLFAAATAHAQTRPQRGSVSCIRADLPEASVLEAETAVRTGNATTIRTTAERHARDLNPHLAACVLAAAKDKVGIESGGDVNHPSYAMADAALRYLTQIGSRPVWELRPTVDTRTPEERKTQLTRRRERRAAADAARSARAAARAAQEPPVMMRAAPARVQWQSGAFQCNKNRDELQPLMRFVLQALSGDVSDVVAAVEPVAKEYGTNDTMCAVQFAKLYLKTKDRNKLSNDSKRIVDRAEEFLAVLRSEPDILP